MKYKFNNGDLQMHISRIINNFKENRENLKDAMPEKSVIENGGEGNKLWYIDVPNIEESYYYVNKKDRNKDFRKLRDIIKIT